MKMFLSALLLALSLVALSPQAMATDASGDLSLQSKFLDRGLVVSDDASAVLNLRVTDVVFDGVFLSTQLATTDVFSGDLQLRTDLGVGYTYDFGVVDLTGSLNHLDNTALYADSFNEVRGEVGVQVATPVRVYGRVARVLSGAEDDTYFGVGVDAQITDKLGVSALATGYAYDLGGTKFNNAELTARYALYREFYGFGTYSTGGRNLVSASIPDQWLVGVGVKF